MIPLELTIEGLYSYQKRQTIDFTKLTSAGLFGIFGTVGSGKSSILEAITYAIYGKTDKLNQSGDNRNYNMMNLKSNELLIDFIFATGKNQTEYKSTVRGRRNSKRFEDVKTFERRAFKKIEEDWVPIEVSDLEKAVGLSYENFKRTIIIPQGQFQEFLQLGNKDRTKMMKELFNLQKFEFYYKVVSLETKNNNKKQHISGQLQQIGTLDPYKVEVYKIQLKDLEISIKEKYLNLNSLLNAEEQLRSLHDKIIKRDEAENSLNNLIRQQPEFTKLENRVIRYEQSNIRFKHLLESLKENRKNNIKRNNQILSDQAKIKLDNENINKLITVVENLKPHFEKREDLRKIADELTTIIKIKKLQKEVDDEAVKVEKGQNYWDETNKVVSDLRKGKLKLEETLTGLRSSMPDFTLLSNIKTWYSEKNNLELQATNIEDEIKKTELREKELISQKEEILKESIFKGAANLSFNECYEFLLSATSKINKQQSKLYEDEKNISVKVRLEAFVENMKADTPCPLCGSLHHPNLFKSDDIKEQLEQINKSKLELEKQHQRITSLGRQLNIIEASHTEIKQRTNDLQKAKDKLSNTIANHLKLFVWDKYHTIDELKNAFEEMGAIQNNIKSCESELNQKLNDLKNHENNLERAKVKIEELKITLAVHKSQLLSLHQQLQIINPQDYTNYNEESIIEEKNNHLNNYKRIEKEYNGYVDELQKKNQLRDILKGRLETNIIEFEKEVSLLRDIELKISEELVESEFTSIEEVETILNDTLDVKAEKLRIEEFKKSLFICKSTFKQSQKEIGNSIYDSKTHNSLIKEIDDLKNQINKMIEERVLINSSYTNLLKSLEAQLSLHKELETLETRSENIKTMKTLFKASGFVNYISSVYLQNLCIAANSRFFQLTRQKLSLEICEENNFRVRDYMNGGKQRSVKTLSGGQTFQASLSLALALADNIQKITESNQNFFFLDEGFGSLDKESLNVVFDTLKSLRKENRIVGVISHVEEMQQEIETHLHIENHEEKGSIIHPSWSNNY